MLIEPLEGRRLCAATHTTFVEGATAFAEIVAIGGGADTHVAGSERGAQVLRATPIATPGQPLALLVVNPHQTTLVVPGPPPAA